MKSKITITLDTNTEKEYDNILTQIGLLLMKNSNKLIAFEVDHKKDI